MASSFTRFRIILITFVVAMLLAMMPLPEWARAFRPEWALLVLIYWTMALPHDVGPGTGWLLGLFMDVAYSNLLGIHALTYALVAYLVLHLHQRIRIFPLQQQIIAIGLILLPYTLILLWIDGIRDQTQPALAYWGPLITGMLLWPWIFILLRKVRRGANLS